MWEHMASAIEAVDRYQERDNGIITARLYSMLLGVPDRTHHM